MKFLLNKNNDILPIQKAVIENFCCFHHVVDYDSVIFPALDLKGFFAGQGSLEVESIFPLQDIEWHSP